MNQPLLFDYFRSTASYRVRIALNLKGVSYKAMPTSLLDGANKTDEYRARNPQGFVPMLSIDGHDLTQSLAIIDYLDSKYPEPGILPVDPVERAQMLAQALVIIADIHPVNNLRILKYLKGEMAQDQDAVDIWYRHWIVEGLPRSRLLLPKLAYMAARRQTSRMCVLVPQMYNARRFDTPLEQFPKLLRIDAALSEIDAFQKAHPDAVKPDA